MSCPHPLLASYGCLGQSDALEQTASDEITSALQTAGLTQDNIQAAVQSYTGLTADTQNAILGIVHGGLPTTFAALAPLVAAGLAATGVGAPIVAAVAAALPILDAIAGIFQPPQPHCDWMVGATCVSGTKPYGPSDPTWTTWEQYVTGSSLLAIDPDPSTQEHNRTLDAAFPYYRQTIGCEMVAIGDHPSDPTQQFFRAYYLAWQKNKEFEINGYSAADEYALLQAVVNAWNGVHAPSPPLQLVGKSPPATQHNPQFCLAVSAGVTYVNLLLDGVIDDRRRPPLTVNLGAVTATATAGAGAPSSSSSGASSSTAGNVARVGAVAILGSGAVWAATTGRLSRWLRL